jgi:hypothetical protein
MRRHIGSLGHMAGSGSGGAKSGGGSGGSVEPAMGSEMVGGKKGKHSKVSKYL